MPNTLRRWMPGSLGPDLLHGACWCESELVVAIAVLKWRWMSVGGIVSYEGAGESVTFLELGPGAARVCRRSNLLTTTHRFSKQLLAKEAVAAESPESFSPLPIQAQHRRMASCLPLDLIGGPE